MRKEKNLLQRECGEILGVTAGAVKRWESGQHVVTREMWEKFKSKGLLPSKPG
jgi:transcriptional regulator with XRE-family HTH domain